MNTRRATAAVIATRRSATYLPSITRVRARKSACPRFAHDEIPISGKREMDAHNRSRIDVDSRTITFEID
jgi:hypothetical protein